MGLVDTNEAVQPNVEFRLRRCYIAMHSATHAAIRGHIWHGLRSTALNNEAYGLVPGLIGAAMSAIMREADDHYV